MQSAGLAGQCVGVPETMDSARRWSGYVCPDCRFVFRVPKDHDGKGVVCPGCRRMLRIPVAGEKLPPLVVPIKNLVAEGREADRSGQQGGGTRRKRKSRQGKGHDWDTDSEGPDGSSDGERRQMFWMMIAGAALFSGIVVWVVTAMLRGPESRDLVPVRADRIMRDAADAAPPPVAAKSDAAILAEAEPLVRKFLEASRIEDLLPLVRHPAVSEPRMRTHYPDGKIDAPGLAAFNATSRLTRQGPLLSVLVRTRDYENRLVALVESPQGLKIDWESWVGWSELPWEEFIATKPTSAKVFRLNLSPVDYYNFSFSDDIKWRSYRLESPDREHAVFGYVERGTVLDSLIQPSPDVKRLPLMLSLRFPENEISGNQVIIDQFIVDGWVLETEETQ